MAITEQQLRTCLMRMRYWIRGSDILNWAASICNPGNSWKRIPNSIAASSGAAKPSNCFSIMSPLQSRPTRLLLAGTRARRDEHPEFCGLLNVSRHSRTAGKILCWRMCIKGWDHSKHTTRREQVGSFRLRSCSSFADQSLLSG